MAEHDLVGVSGVVAPVGPRGLDAHLVGGALVAHGPGGHDVGQHPTVGAELGSRRRLAGGAGVGDSDRVGVGRRRRACRPGGRRTGGARRCRGGCPRRRGRWPVVVGEDAHARLLTEHRGAGGVVGQAEVREGRGAAPAVERRRAREQGRAGSRSPAGRPARRRGSTVAAVTPSGAPRSSGGRSGVGRTGPTPCRPAAGRSRHRRGPRPQRSPTRGSGSRPWHRSTGGRCPRWPGGRRRRRCPRPDPRPSRPGSA